MTSSSGGECDRAIEFFYAHFKMADSYSYWRHSKTSFEKNCFSAWASTLNMGLINKVDMVCLSPVGYGV